MMLQTKKENAPNNRPLFTINYKVPEMISRKHLCEISSGKLTDEICKKIKAGKRPFKWQWSDNGKDVDINSIKHEERKYYNLPLTNERIKAAVEVIKQKEIYDDTIGDNPKVWEISGRMVDAKKRDFQGYYNLINEKYNLTKEQCREFAEKCAVWTWIVQNYKREKNSLEIYNAAYKWIFPKHLKGAKNSFSNFLRDCQNPEIGIEKTVIDGRAIAKTEKRISKFQYALLQSLYIQPQKIQAPAAHAKLVEACKGANEKPYSLPSVKNYFREFVNNAELYALRYGAAAAQKQLPYASLLPAEHRNTQWQQDGWTLPFWGADFQRYTLYLIRDNHSRKIVGSAIAASENTTLILEALEDAMRNTGVFPGEIVMDKHSFTKTDLAARLRTETEKMGAVWTVTVNAQRNQIAERYNQYLDAICKDFEGYLGKNMTATGKDSRPAPEVLTNLRRTVNFKTEDEIKAIAAYVVLEFNKMKLEPLEGLSPNEKYALSESKKAFVLSETERIALIRPVNAHKVSRGQINIKVGMIKHEFQLPAHLIDLYNNRKLIVVYEDLLQGIYITDPMSGEDLGCIMPKRKIHGAIPDQTPDDKKKLNQMTGRTNGVTTKARKTALQKTAEALAMNPDQVALMEANTLPKDIRQEALQNSELKKAMGDHGVNANMLPIRAAKAAEVTGAEATGRKTKNSPFTPAKNEIKIMTIDDILNA